MNTDSKLIELEAKLFAHRRLIQILIKQLSAQQKEPEKFWAEFENCVIVQDHQEDPGVVQPDVAFAYNAITEFEYTRLVADAKVRDPALPVAVAAHEVERVKGIESSP